MTADLARSIVRRSHELEGAVLDAQARHLGAEDWWALTGGLTFHESGTGGGLAMLTAALPMGHLLALTDGEADLPTAADHFRLAILDADDREVLHVQYGGNHRD